MHKWFANCKHLIAWKVINFMNEFVKRSYNFGANKNCAPIISKQHNSKQMQQQENAIKGKQDKVNNFITLLKLEQTNLK